MKRDCTMRRVLGAWMLGMAAALSAGAGEAPVLAVFTDEAAVVPVAPQERERALTLQVLTGEGWFARAGATTFSAGTLAARSPAFSCRPLTEGIHILAEADGAPEGAGREVGRFLALRPPLGADPAALADNLPCRGGALLAGEPFRIVALGDSVTATGDYPRFLAMMLERATGNHRIAVRKSAFPGRSVDAAVRTFAAQVLPEPFELALLMYGLNDQASRVPEEAYTAQYAWIAGRVRHEARADIVFLEPTPHYEILPALTKDGSANPPDYAFRTLPYARLLRPLARELRVPLVPSFAALWLPGAEDLPATARRMLTCYPPHFAQQLHAIAEAPQPGRADTIHPNALGHVRIARAVYERLNNRGDAEPLQMSGQSVWQHNRIVSTLLVQAAGNSPRSGRLVLYPPAGVTMTAESVDSATSSALRGLEFPYRLEAGQTLTLRILWPGLLRPQDLLSPAARAVFCADGPMVRLVDYSGGGSRVYAPALPFSPGCRYVRERQVLGEKDALFARINTPAGLVRQEVPLPVGAELFRISLSYAQPVDGQPQWAAAEAAGVRFAGALAGEAVCDGDLAEWSGAGWSGLGAPSQARWVGGPEDHRKTPEECQPYFSLKAGKSGVCVALRVEGENPAGEFQIFFDPREPEQLGTVGPYYWVSGALRPDGTVSLQPGETSPRLRLAPGKWRLAGQQAQAEFLLPYPLFSCNAWPASGDLGLSVLWTHRGADGQLTHLMWAENGHPWNPRWYGVARLVQDVQTPLPWRVRIE